MRRDPGRALSQSPLRPIRPLRSTRELPSAVWEACGTKSPEVLGMELDVLPAADYLFYDRKLFPRQKIRDISGLILRLRMIKSRWEVERMRGAAALAQAVADAVPRFLKEGISEHDLSIELETVARKAGHLGLVRVRKFNMDMFSGTSCRDRKPRYRPIRTLPREERAGAPHSAWGPACVKSERERSSALTSR